jgi:protein phosphatase 1 regulatory subunit 3A/B/C/D/E
VNADEPPQVPASALKDLHIRRRKRSKSQLVYQLDFDQPGSDPSFIKRVLADKVALENCICNLQPGPSASSPEQLTISGIIRVANIAFDKRVFVRYSMDGWRKGGTEYDVAASYLPGSNDGATDRFAFVMLQPEGSMQAPGSRLEFAVAFDAAGTLYWDSNGGANYGVDCSALDQSPSSPGPGVPTAGETA